MSLSSPALAGFHKTLAGWFDQTFGDPTPVQLEAWAAIVEGRHTLIAAPTGSGKTLAALLPCLNRLAQRKLVAAARGKALPPGVRVLYITPLKALNNDIQHHLVGFMEDIERFESGDDGDATEAWPGIRSAVRTGDTPSSERARMARRPPDVLVTTPESLYLLLTSDKGRTMLGTVETVIVDEIHSLAGDKRGAHLSLSLERLSALAAQPVQRIGVSATQKPLSRVARFLGGWEPQAGAGFSADAGDGAADRQGQLRADASESAAALQGGLRAGADGGPGQLAAPEAEPVHPLGYAQRRVVIVESTMTKSIEVRVTMPDLSRPARTRYGVWQPIIERMMALMEGARSVLLFVNSRRMCERLVLRLNEHAGYELARAHHGSLSRERRLEVERMLKAGELRCLVATSSLELGIDVGHVDLVIQVDSPKAAAAGIQRIGRAGHAVGDVSRGFIIARSRSELPEAAVLCRNIGRRDIEAITLPREPLDVLSQHMTSIVAAEDITIDALYRLIIQSECFRGFPRTRLEAALKVLSGFYPFARPLMEWDRATDTLRKRANTSMAAITGAGTIPQSSAYPVHHADSRTHLGELDETYIAESRVGDVFQLGTSSWMISSIENDRVYVQEAPNRFSEIPFWQAENASRSVEVGIQLGHFLEQLSAKLALDDPTNKSDSELSKKREDITIAWLDAEYGLDHYAASELIGLVQSQHHTLGLPTERRIIIEHYRDLMNQTRIIIHNPFGRRINRTWLLAIERQFQRLLPYSMYGNAKDNGIELVVPDWDASWLQTLWQITADSVESLLTEAITGSPFLGLSFRRIAETSLLLSRSFTRTPMWQKRLRCEELLKQSLPYAEQFPYLEEAMRECLHDYLDTNGLKQLLESITAGQIEVLVKESHAPSPFAVQFLSDYANMMLYEGDGLSEATQLQLLSVSKSLAGQLFGEEAVQRAVDPGIAQQEQERLETGGRQVPANAVELYMLLKQRGDLSTEELTAIAGEAVPGWLQTLRDAGRIAEQPFGRGQRRWICAEEQDMYNAFPKSDSAIAFIAGRFADHRLSFTEVELREHYPDLSPAQAAHIPEVLLQLDRIEAAPFADGEEERIWTSRTVAKRLIRLTMEQARKQAEPIDPIRWCTHMSMLQHALSGSQLSGIDGLRMVIERLQGFFLPASHWESVLFPSRVIGYRKDDLDLLCASGEIIWIGRKEENEKEGKIAFFLSESKPLYAPEIARAVQAASSTKHPRLLSLLQEGGASFLTKLSRDYGKVPSELLTDLLDLIWEGTVSNDQFAPLRLQLQTKGKQLARTGSGLGRWYWTGPLSEQPDLRPSAIAAQPGQTGLSVSPVPLDQPGQTAEPTGIAAPIDAAQLRSVSSELSESALHWTQHLLDSYGIVSKDLVAQLSPFSWEELLPMLKQLEQWGVVTRGLLVQGVQTLQFARREGIASVRQPLPGQDNAAVTVLAATDPANPFGLAADWPSVRGTGFARKSGNYLVLQHGQWRFWLENNGRHIVDLSALSTPSDEASPTGNAVGAAELKEIFRMLLRQHGLSKIKIDRWNGEPITESAAAQEMLRAMGAERDNRSLVLWPSNLR
ncbi:DEAD/DEAH box helicase [Paenibacillus sp. CF384]|uniref:DEAD/DEAH box helicase n=1 Tax=Paenibacillus sp. CF384 TaxID=1884382 RepID=UPI0008988DF6|nr:DEAD/DEAH box helicase [Paenibacillus sp. CF384]SDX86732.1 ATP dependent helicase, Lhr family [Paenibacillus sp. CF384]